MLSLSNHLVRTVKLVVSEVTCVKLGLRNLSTMPKFCANLSFMFTEQPFQERYKLAKDAGFKAVESGFPFGLTKEEIVNAKTSANIQQVLINIYTGDVTKGELGFAAIPGKEEEFKNSLQVTLEYAKAVGAQKMHIMAGKVEQVTAAHDQVYESNLRYAAKVLEKENIIGLIEPINNYSVPHYYLNSYQKALSVIKNINSTHLKLMLDIFHLQQIQGDVFHTIDKLIPYIGHVQIAQVPNRNEPDTPGELNFQYIFEVLEENGYNDWIGLEYKPAATTVEGLKWIKNFNYSL
ncbi:hypothetical protein ILUMI_27186 [Ignelater luminosus]|uniref:Putative hydroxypyruvate isomerase n=1 Tax=Ignelater luminosus TaxID=2038154 RepID=A0A8K0C5K2_IGNLU|nr:hypothetical protein ILUMI_27186 [Ignelater luminosus]